MSGKITPPPAAPHQCTGRPDAKRHARGTVWTCNNCGKQFVVVFGAQYNESYVAWRPLTEANRNGHDR